MKRITRIVCDCCGKVNPKLLKPKSRFTECCKYDAGNGVQMSEGKTWREYLQFPIKIKWVGFWSKF